jgi:hypothetical protein
MIINDDSSIIIKWSFKLIDAARGIIYDCHMFILQAPGLYIGNNEKRLMNFHLLLSEESPSWLLLLLLLLLWQSAFNVVKLFIFFVIDDATEEEISTSLF